eukprot:4441147-Ditylum_brightwellii.AAC.1
MELKDPCFQDLGKIQDRNESSTESIEMYRRIDSTRFHQSSQYYEYGSRGYPTRNEESSKYNI